KELTKQILEKGYWTTRRNGKDPQATLYAELLHDKRFKRPDPNVWALSGWGAPRSLSLSPQQESEGAAQETNVESRETHVEPQETSDLKNSANLADTTQVDDAEMFIVSDRRVQ